MKREPAIDCADASSKTTEPSEKKYPKTDMNNSSVIEGFRLVKLLNCHNDTKTIFLHVEKDDKTGVIIFEKQPFDETVADNVLQSELNFSTLEFENDIYSTHKIRSASKMANEIKMTLIYPATERHLLKYATKEPFVFEETPEVYKEIIQPFFLKQALNCQWVYNILEKKSETERIICEDTDESSGFLCIPDLRSDLKDLQTFHALAIVKRRDLLSIRDLRSEHIPMLKNIQATCLREIKNKYGVTKDKLRVFLHYQPTFYHLHIHFVSIYINGPHVQAERAHLLSDVIQNLEWSSDFYKNRTITYVVNEKDSLMDLLSESLNFAKNS